MFSKVRKINFEFHSYCNRECAWCPNSKLKRNNKDYEISDYLFDNLLKELKENNFGMYNGNYTSPLKRHESESIFSFLGFQEPFTSSDLFKKRVSEVYSALPSTVRIIANSNGDFLTKKSLDELLLTSLDIMDYDNKGIEYWENKLRDLNILVIDKNVQTEILIGIHRYVGSIKVHCNWSKHWEIEDRAGFFKKEDLQNIIWKNDLQERTFPCYEMQFNLTIDYQGNVMPCCHMRSDNIQHQDFILGNLNNSSLVDIYTSNKFLELKDNLLNSSFPSVCKNCQKTRIENFI